MHILLTIILSLLAAMTTMAKAQDSLSPHALRQYADKECGAGETCAGKRQLSDAMNHYLAALRVSDANGMDEVSCQAYIGIGNLYSQHADYAMGIRYYEKALGMARRSGNTSLQNKALNNLVGASCFAGKNADAKRYYGMMKANREHSHEYQYNLMMCQGIIEANTGHAPTAIACYKQALNYVQAHGLTGGYREATLSCLAQLYDDAHMPDSALLCLSHNERTARATGQRDLLLETLKHQASIYLARGDKRSALDCKEEYLALADSMYNNEEFNNMKNSQIMYEANKSETAIHSLQEEKQLRDDKIALQRVWLSTLALGAAAFIVLFAIVYRQKRQLSQAYNNLFDRNQELLRHNDSHDDAPDAQEHNSLQLTSEQRSTLLECIKRVMENTDEVCNPDFNIERLANIVGSNSRYVSAAINDGCDRNFRTLLNEYRMKEAMKRLADIDHYGNYTIKAVAESVGYKSQANFIAVFSKATGMKPSIYRKISQERAAANSITNS